MRPFSRLFIFLLASLMLSACATLSPNFQQPQVSVTGISIAPESKGISPLFNIGLRVVNPNRSALPLQGMTYSVEVEGHRLLTGATADLPRIAAYDTADIMIQASPDLFGSARLLNQLLSGQQQGLKYLFKAQLDVGRLLPLITIEEKGELTYPAK